jgi:hypothetical protein
MPQLNCYVSDRTAELLKNKADLAHTSVSEYLADLIRQDIGSELPEDFFELYGAWKGEPLTRGEQSELEQRPEPVLQPPKLDANGWPESYFEGLAAWEGEDLVRPKQGEYETRLEFD